MYEEIIARLKTTQKAFEKDTNGERAIQEAITYIEQAQNTINYFQRYIEQNENTKTTKTTIIKELIEITAKQYNIKLTASPLNCRELAESLINNKDYATISTLLFAILDLEKRVNDFIISITQ